MKCLLCQHAANPFELDTFKCSECNLLFKNPSSFLNLEEEKKRYSTHENNSTDEGYINFLNRLVTPLKKVIDPNMSLALDYGCGPGPTLFQLLSNENLSCKNYDPHFFPDNRLLIKNEYDVVTSTEVVEHFYQPFKDWELMFSLIKPNGLLGIMTQFIDQKIDYKSWWYKNDPTHVVFYEVKTLEYLSQKYNSKIVYCDNKSVVIFKKGA